MEQPRRLPHKLDGRALFARAASAMGLLEGWQRVWSNQGAAGGDGVTCQKFSIGVKERLAELSRELNDGEYRPGPLRGVDIPKKSGGVRTLSIPCVRDRVAQSSVALLLTPLLDREFEDASYGYRPGRSVKQAVEKVRRLRTEGFIWTVDADIKGYFDNIPHDKLMARFLRSVTESSLSELVALWLETGSANGRGLPQGSPLSPVLANLYLDDLDEALSAKGLRLVRFADDFVVLSKDRHGAEQALSRAEKLLADNGLMLNHEKTRIRSFDNSLRFLGHLFVRSWLMPDPQGDDLDEAEAMLRRVAEADRKTHEAELGETERRETEEAAGYDRGLRVLYLYKPGRSLGLKNLSFAVYEDFDGCGPAEPELLLAVHHTRIDRIELGPRASTDIETLKHALACGIPVSMVNGHGETLGTLAAPLTPHASRHLAQARLRLDDQLRLDLARRIVDGRLRNQRALLRRLNQRHGLQEVVAVLLALNGAIRKTDAIATVDELLGHEGASTAQYWRGWSALLLHGFSLPKRQRSPVIDPVNGVLNATAALLTRDVSAIVQSRGLHPGFGVLHGAMDDHEGCVYDLMEEFRAQFVEGLTLYILNNRIVSHEMFSQGESGGVRMSNGAMSALIRAYEDRAASLIKSPRSGHRVTWRRLMIEQAEAYAAHVEKRRPYHPYVMDY